MPEQPAALDLLRVSLTEHLLSVERALGAAEAGDVAAARAAMESGVPSLMQAGKAVRTIENAEHRAICEARSRPFEP